MLGVIAGVASLAVTGCSSEGASASPATIGGLHGAVLPPSLQPAALTLLDTAGKPFAFPSDATARVTLLYFGYTNCQDECPTTMATLASARRRFDAGLRGRVQVLFVTTDPARDTAEALGAWLAQFDASFIGLRGTEEQVARLMGSMALGAPAHDTATAAGAYQVVHATNVLVYPGWGKSWLLYDPETTAADWAADLARLGEAKAQ